LAEQHGHELSPTTEPASLTLSPVLGDGCSNSCRENNCNIWLRMLDTRITAVIVLPIGIASRNANRSRVLPPLLKTYFGQQCLISQVLDFTIDGPRKMP
jgi:hypothetical protein